LFIEAENHIDISLQPLKEKIFIMNGSNNKLKKILMKNILIKPNNFLVTLEKIIAENENLYFTMAFLKIIHTLKYKFFDGHKKNY